MRIGPVWTCVSICEGWKNDGLDVALYAGQGGGQEMQGMPGTDSDEQPGSVMGGREEADSGKQPGMRTPAGVPVRKEDPARG